MKIISRQEWGARPPTKTWLKHIPKRIVLHHSWAPNTAQWKGAGTVRAIQKFHIEAQKWPDIGYHFIVSPDGSEVYGCNAVTDLTYHCGGNPPAGAKRVFGNTGSIGICLIGNYDLEVPNPTAVLTLQTLINDVCAQNNMKPGHVFGHFDSWAPTPPKTCPGKNLADAFGMLTRWKLACLCN